MFRNGQQSVFLSLPSSWRARRYTAAPTLSNRLESGNNKQERERERRSDCGKELYFMVGLRSAYISHLCLYFL